MTGKGDCAADPRGLVREAYRIEGITAADCRTIFLDWALGLDTPVDTATIRILVEHYGRDAPDHPMTLVLREGLERTARPGTRRGGNRRRGNHGAD
jgi:hypothetical protein